MRKYPVILFFVAGVMPTEDDFKEAERLGPNVKFRNASAVPETGCLEKCDGVAGEVPERYAAACPTAEEAIEAFIEAHREGLPKPEAVAKKATKAKAAAKSEETAEGSKPVAKSVNWTPNANAQ